MFKSWILVLTLAGLASVVAPVATAQDAPSADQQAAPAGAPPQRGGHGRFDPDRRADMLAKKLSLSSDQQTKVADIFKSEQSEMQKLHSDASASQQDRRSKMMVLHKSSTDQIRALLNPDQQKKWDEMMSRREQWVKGRHDAPPASAPDTNQK